MNQFQPMGPSAYMPMPQPYQPYQQAYQPTPVRAMPQISGRVVNSLDDITVQEVPTDGTMALFPAADGSCVYAKRWTPDGNISTTRFVQEAQEAPQAQPSPFDVINDRISELFDVVERIDERLPLRL